MDSFNFLLHPLFWIWYIKFKNRFFLYINLKWRAIFEISRLLIRDSDLLNFLHFSGYKYKIRLVSRFRKREDQALFSISTILKFPALVHFFIPVKVIYWMFKVGNFCLKNMQTFFIIENAQNYTENPREAEYIMVT